MAEDGKRRGGGIEQSERRRKRLQIDKVLILT